MSTPSTARFTVKTRLTPKARRRERRCVENTDYAAFARRVVTAHGRRVADGDVEGLPALVDLTRHLEDAITHAIAGLRTAGYSWSDIALRLGITRQAAHQRWGKNFHPPDLELDPGDIDMSEVPW